MGLTNSAIDSSNQSTHSEISIHKNITRTPLKLPTPTVHVPENSDTDFLTSTPLSKVNENEIAEPKNVCSAVHEKPEAGKPKLRCLIMQNKGNCIHNS